MALTAALTDPAHGFPPTVHAWLQRGLAQFLRGGVSLESALGLERRRDRRDAYIRTAASHLRGTVHDQARALVPFGQHPERFARWRGPVGTAMRLALGHGRLPATARSYRRILAPAKAQGRATSANLGD